MSLKPKPLLDRIESPHQLHRLSDDELNQLAKEIRERIIEVVSRQGGHLASNLGVTDLTIALHYVFDFTHDHLLWDVGHQCYPHKMLTGRAKDFGSLRRREGLSGFPAPSESDYDLFATGHAGAAISTALGLAWADQAAGRDNKTIAVVGDASIVNGLALEGINNATLLNRQFMIILNDNSMAIDRTRGGLAQVLDTVRLTHAYKDLKNSAEHVLHHVPLGNEIRQALENLKESIKITVHGRQIFESMGIAYFGPIDGHDIPQMIRVLRRIAKVNHPVLLHVHTEKGRGAQYAMEDPCLFHSPTAYEHQGDKAILPDSQHPTWTQVFSDALVARAEKDERIVAITAAMPDGTGLIEFREKFPHRYIDVGICESNAVAMAAGIAKGGYRPIVAIYSTFMQRAFDQMFEEAALQKLPILVCMDRAGLVGSDGAVHHGFSDIAYLRPLPGMVLMAPADQAELGAAMDLALSLDQPSAIRYPRDLVPENLPGVCDPFEPGKARICLPGEDGTFLAYGTLTEQALEAAEILRAKDGLSIGVVNARFAKPLDANLISRLISAGKPLVICEDHARIGGFGSAVMELAAERGLNTANVRLMGIPDRFISHAKRQEQLSEVGLDPLNLAAVMRDLTRQQQKTPAPN